MNDRTGSRSLRFMAIIVLSIGLAPMAISWSSAYLMQRDEAIQQNASDTDAQAWTAPDEIEIELKPGSDNGTLADLGKRIGASFTWNSSFSSTETEIADVKLPQGADVNADLAALRADSRVVAADVTHIYRIPASEMTAARPPSSSIKSPDENRGWKPDDPRYGEQWNFRMIHAESAWEVNRGKGVVVAVIDTGVAFDNTSRGKQARDFGQTKFVPGYDFVHHDSIPNDDQGHGTHVAGTIAESTNNGEGVAGLAFEASIMPLKVLNSYGSGSSRDIAEAIRWAADHGANVINMSLGSPYPDQLMSSACTYAASRGVTIVCAAGNSGKEGVGYPAAYPECIAISSVGPSGKLSYFSSFGKQVAIAAPGGDKQAGGEAGGILQNTLLEDDHGAMVDDYYSFQGTSMASPHAAAVAAMIVGSGVKSPKDVKAILQKSASKKTPAKQYGAGILDAGAAVRLAANSYHDGVARFWIVAALFAGCWLIGKARAGMREQNPYPFWATAALSFGLLFPDWIAGFAGFGSPLNIIGHSVIVPGALLMLGARNGERRLLGAMAFGMMLHVGWELLRGTSPFGPEISTLQLMPWVSANLIVGFGIVVAGLAARKEQ